MTNNRLLSFRNNDLTSGQLLDHRPNLEKNTLDKIKKHATEMHNDWRPAIGASFKDYSFQGFAMKRAIAKKCSFYNCNFNRVAGTGSHWSNSKFINCNLSETNFDFSNFQNSNFIYDETPLKEAHYKGPGLVGASFSGASFKGSILQNVYARGTSLSRTDFSEAELIDCHIQSCTLEGANFRNAKITNLSFDRINIEYCDFTDTRFSNVSIALMQFPYVFGINEKTIRSGNLAIQTNDTRNFSDGILPWNDLLEFIPNLVDYYLNNQNYFPVCNLYLASNRKEEFINYLNQGIRLAMMQREFRTIKFLCKLARKSEFFNAAELSELYALINSIYIESFDDEFAAHSYHIHEGEIRYELLSPDTKESLKLEIMFSPKSNHSALESINECLNTLFSVYESLGLLVSWNNITISHNSPYKSTVNIIVVYKDENNKKPQKEPKTSFINVMQVIFTGMSAAALWFNTLSTIEKQPVLEAQQKIERSFKIHSLTINQGSRLYLSINEDDIKNPDLINKGDIKKSDLKNEDQ
jgi:uncharacterized protein YjbI with pentapeptide repeats